MGDTAKNASGDVFAIRRSNGTWYAEQITGLSGNWLGHAALLHAVSRGSLLRQLASHYSNAVI